METAPAGDAQQTGAVHVAQVEPLAAPPAQEDPCAGAVDCVPPADCNATPDTYPCRGGAQIDPAAVDPGAVDPGLVDIVAMDDFIYSEPSVDTTPPPSNPFNPPANSQPPNPFNPPTPPPANPFNPPA